ncbi:type II toxin-antitoxin system Phd/YefM family antitoxin [Rhodobacteraceae bacterium R_SAG10]|nr:type II toxin-antitoxin system Phd/YefM family antitoxin [Rhodobacteraceae bacterium R_SAG10]
MVIRVNITDVRPQLSRLVGMAEHVGKKVIIARHGKPVAALVSMADFYRIWKDEDEELYGPVDPVSGRRRGGLRLSGMLERGLARLRHQGKTLDDVLADQKEE